RRSGPLVRMVRPRATTSLLSHLERHDHPYVGVDRRVVARFGMRVQWDGAVENVLTRYEAVPQPDDVLPVTAVENAAEGISRRGVVQIVLVPTLDIGSGMAGVESKEVGFV